MPAKKLRIGVLGCGPIAQFVHFEACRKGYNTELYAICDVADDLRNKMNLIWSPEKAYSDYVMMLEDPKVQAVIIATSDEYHIPLAMKAVKAGKHVLIEKPLSHSLDECLELKESVESNPVYIQVGHMKRFDPGIEFAGEFVHQKMGRMVAFKAWYADHVRRYTATDNLQSIPITSQKSVLPKFDRKTDPARYYMLAHGSHLIDTAMFLGGQIASVRARYTNLEDIHCWFVDVEFMSGALGHLDLTIKFRGDWHEGFQIYGEHGSVIGKTYNPWYYKSSNVECYLEEHQVYQKPLGADGFSFRRQLEHFACVILDSEPPKGCTLDQGIEIVRAMMAIKRSVDSGKPIYLDRITNGYL